MIEAATIEEQPKKKRATIAKRSKAEKAESDSTCTPLWLNQLLFDQHGWFDIDPLSNDRSTVFARWYYSIARKLDGTKLPWRGSAFVNWPYGNPTPFAYKASYELSLGRCTEAVILCKVDPSTEWWGIATAPIPRVTTHRNPDGFSRGGTRILTWHKPDLWLFNDRIQHDESPDLVAKRVAEYEIAKARYAITGDRADKPKGKKDGKSQNNFCSAIIHHRFDKPQLTCLEQYATLWTRG